ncbi:uncharacterized protein LOC107622373 isoform X2 [Arachis ipaensis]|uniref:uncharacterized protein LOC107622373 isoform X2 n=1 Tax=Arachis ipaensis TaxID=130454 RepID=UPI000A2B8CDD|nr:uncharacterized protein LOC107622373 isoform X2 [Arachis ipaensis]XP_025686103.1 uncharacterized protein LOC112786940 isoform X2 [Arachis hypogaea]
MLLSLLLPLPLSSIELAVAGGEPVSRPCIQSHHRHCYSSNFASVLLEFAISAPLKLPLVLFLPVRAIGAAATPFLLSSLLQKSSEPLELQLLLSCCWVSTNQGRRFVLLAWQGVGFVPLVYWSGTRTRKGQRFHPACSWLRSDVGMVVSSRLYSLCLQGEGGRALIARLYASWECTEERRYLGYNQWRNSEIIHLLLLRLNYWLSMSR